MVLWMVELTPPQTLFTMMESVTSLILPSFPTPPSTSSMPGQSSNFPTGWSRNSWGVVACTFHYHHRSATYIIIRYREPLIFHMLITCSMYKACDSYLLTTVLILMLHCSRYRSLAASFPIHLSLQPHTQSSWKSGQVELLLRAYSMQIACVELYTFQCRIMLMHTYRLRLGCASVLVLWRLFQGWMGVLKVHSSSCSVMHQCSIPPPSGSGIRVWP